MEKTILLKYLKIVQDMENNYVGNFGNLRTLRNYFDRPTKLFSDLPS